jgi:hypothetical protein
MVCSLTSIDEINDIISNHSGQSGTTNLKLGKDYSHHSKQLTECRILRLIKWINRVLISSSQVETALITQSN